jgi:hypothetical protein
LIEESLYSEKDLYISYESLLGHLISTQDKKIAFRNVLRAVDFEDISNIILPNALSVIVTCMDYVKLEELLYKKLNLLERTS